MLLTVVYYVYTTVELYLFYNTLKESLLVYFSYSRSVAPDLENLGPNSQQPCFGLPFWLYTDSDLPWKLKILQYHYQ